MLMIRLQRVGRKHETVFRVVVVDSRRGTKSGRTLETVGSYDPRRGKPVLKVDRIKYWLSVGTQASGTVHNLLVDAKILSKTKINVLPKRKPKVKVEETKAEKPVIIESAVPVEPLPV
jgi:small subunit ribosomal protein S16